MQKPHTKERVSFYTNIFIVDLEKRCFLAHHMSYFDNLDILIIIFVFVLRSKNGCNKFFDTELVTIQQLIYYREFYTIYRKHSQLQSVRKPTNVSLST